MFLSWFVALCKKWSVHVTHYIVFSLKLQPIAMFSFNHCVISRLGNWTKTLQLVGWAKIQYTRDDEPIISCINQGKNIDNVCIEFPNLPILLTMSLISVNGVQFLQLICSCLIIISPQSHVRRVTEWFKFDSTKHRRFPRGTQISSCSNTGPRTDGLTACLDRTV